MQFFSFGFLMFLPVVVLINMIIPRKFRYLWLLVTSYAFYVCIDLKGTVVLVLSTLMTYFFGILIEKSQKPKVLLFSGITLSILFIFVCKYLNYFITVIYNAAGKENSNLGVKLIASIGISFYMLKAITYMVDVYRGDLKAERNFLKYALFVSFFPQILSGPIERAGNMLPQFSYPVTVDFDRLREGLLQMLWGYFMKLVLADRLAIFVSSVFDEQMLPSGTIVLIGTLFYSFEIYCDFAGYSNIAIGTAKILGIDTMNNFECPYLSASVPEFWRRWHISLSTLFKNYVYIPLGGNRKGKFRKYLNILIVFAVSGIWHGVGVTFLVWGIIHGLYQVVGYLLKPVRDALCRILNVKRDSFSHQCLKTIFTFGLVNFAWVFFRADSCSQAMNIISRCLEFTPWVITDGSLYKYGLDMSNMFLLAAGITVLVIVDILNYKGVIVREKILSQGLWLRWTVAIAGILLVLICGIWGPGYDAGSFIYQQF